MSYGSSRSTSNKTQVLTTQDQMLVPPGIKSETVAALRIALSLAGLPPQERRIVDLRPALPFFRLHLRHSVHVPQGPEGLMSRFSSLPPRHVPFVVVCQRKHEDWVRNNLGGLRRRVQGVVLCPDTDSDPASIPARQSGRLAYQPQTQLQSQPQPKLDDVLRSNEKAILTGTDTGPLLSPNGKLLSAPDEEFWRLAQCFQLTYRSPPGLTPLQRLIDPWDRPRYLGQPAPVVRRAAEHVARLYGRRRTAQEDMAQQHTAPRLTVLDLGCGAGRDLAWLCYNHAWRPPATSHSGIGLEERQTEKGADNQEADAEWQSEGGGEVDWLAVGADNLRPVLERAKIIFEDFGLLSSSPDSRSSRPLEGESGRGGEYGQIAKIVWSEVRRDGTMGILSGPGRGPRSATRLDGGPGPSAAPFPSEPFSETPSSVPLTHTWSSTRSNEELAQQRRALQQFAREHLDPYTAPPKAGRPDDLQDRTTKLLDQTDGPGGGDELSKMVTFDLLLFVRFLPRQLLLALPALSHPGSVVVISHFYDLARDPRWSAVSEETSSVEPPKSGPARRLLPAGQGLDPLAVLQWPRAEYESPPAPARIAPGDLERLVGFWNTVPVLDGGTALEGELQQWRVLEQVAEPIEDSRPVLSTIVRRTR